MSLNYISLSGQLTRDSELRYTLSGKPILEFYLKVEDQNQEAHTLRVIDRKAASPERQKVLRSGERVLVEGHLINRKLEQSKSYSRTQPEIHLDSLMILSN